MNRHELPVEAHHAVQRRLDELLRVDLAGSLREPRQHRRGEVVATDRQRVPTLARRGEEAGRVGKPCGGSVVRLTLVRRHVDDFAHIHRKQNATVREELAVDRVGERRELRQLAAARRQKEELSRPRQVGGDEQRRSVGRERERPCLRQLKERPQPRHAGRLRRRRRRAPG